MRGRGDGAKDKVKSDLVPQLGKELLIVINRGNGVVLVLGVSTYYLTNPPEDEWGGVESALLCR